MRCRLSCNIDGEIANMTNLDASEKVFRKYNLSWCTTAIARSGQNTLQRFAEVPGPGSDLRSARQERQERLCVNKRSATQPGFHADEMSREESTWQERRRKDKRFRPWPARRPWLFPLTARQERLSVTISLSRLGTCRVPSRISAWLAGVGLPGS